METIGRKAGIKSRKTVSKAIEVLEAFNILEVEKATGSDGKRLNNIYHLSSPKAWKGAPTIKSTAKLVVVADLSEVQDNPIQKMAEHESRVKAEELDRAVYPWLNYEAWQEWVAYRKEKKQALKPSTIKLQIAFLQKNKTDHAEIIRTSIMHGWTGLFPLKKEKTVPKVEVPEGKYAHLSK